MPVIFFSCNSCTFTYSENAQPFIKNCNTNLWQSWNILEWPVNLSFSKALKLNYRPGPGFPSPGVCCVVHHKIGFQMVDGGLVQATAGLLLVAFFWQQGTSRKTFMKSRYRWLTAVLFFFFSSLSFFSPGTYIQSKVINYQSMGITLLPAAHLELSQETRGRRWSSQYSCLRHQFPRGVTQQSSFTAVCQAASGLPWPFANPLNTYPRILLRPRLLQSLSLQFCITGAGHSRT